MSDSMLFAFGCAVAFIAVSGAYVYLREQYRQATRAVSRVDARRADHHARQERLAPGGAA